MQVFSKNWFAKHQKTILWFANTWIGRIVLCINGAKSSVGKNKILAILPNAIAWKDGEEFKAEFRAHDKFGKRLYYAFLPFWYLLHFVDWLLLDRFKLLNRWNFGFLTLTAYPDAATGSTTVDGYVNRSGVNENWATIRAGAGNTNDTSGTLIIVEVDSNGSSNLSQLFRGIATFNTAALTAAATISSAVLSSYAVNKGGTFSSQTPFHACGSTPASNNSLANSDYGNLGTTTFGNVAYASWTNAAYNDITLNASGLSNISKTSISKFGWRLGWDIDNTTPPIEVSKTMFFSFNSADQTGTANDPKLVVTYTLPAGGNTLSILSLF